MEKKHLLTKAAKIVMKWTEIVYWIDTAVMLASAVIALTNRAFIAEFWAEHADAAGKVSMSVCGFEQIVPVESSARASVLFFIAAVVLPALMAMIFRNLYRIIKKSEGGTPFQAENLRLLREIGIFAIAIPLVGLALSTVSRLLLGVDAVETSVQMQGFSMGLAVLCLTQFFAHGIALENDMEGLV